MKKRTIELTIIILALTCVAVGLLSLGHYLIDEAEAGNIARCPSDERVWAEPSHSVVYDGERTSVYCKGEFVEHFIGECNIHTNCLLCNTEFYSTGKGRFREIFEVFEPNEPEDKQ